jgi:predicted Zn-ribbon and HTH transcriptional regulator
MPNTENSLDIIKIVLCKKCNYEWEPRVENPKSCPRCKYRLDYEEIKINRPKVESLG